MQLFNQPCAEISKLKAANVAAVEMLCVRPKGCECDFTSIAKRKKKKLLSSCCPVLGVAGWGMCGLSAWCHDKSKFWLRSTSHNISFTSGPPTFLSERRIEVFFTWSYTNYVRFSCLAMQQHCCQRWKRYPQRTEILS